MQIFSDGLARLCNERFEALLAEPRGKELLDPHLQTARASLCTFSALKAKPGEAELDAHDTNTKHVNVLDAG